MYSTSHRLMWAVVSGLAVAGCGQQTARVPAAEVSVAPAVETLEHIVWYRVGLHHNDDLHLRSNGTYTLVERGTYFNEASLNEPAEAAGYVTETQTSSGKWRAVVDGMIYLQMDHPHYPAWQGLARLCHRGNNFNFDEIPSHSGGLPIDADPTVCLLVAENLFAPMTGLARYSDEQDISALIGTRQLAVPDHSPAELAATIEHALPQGWSVTLFGDALVVARDEPIRTVFDVLNGPAYVPGELQNNFNNTIDLRYTILLRVARLKTAQEVEALRRENAALDKQLNAMRRAMGGIIGLGDSFSPRTPEQVQRVNAYLRAKSGRKPVPNYHWDRYSIVITESLGEWDHTQEQQAIDHVKDEVLKLFESY